MKNILKKIYWFVPLLTEAIAGYSIFFLSFLFPKKRKRWIFGAWLGQKYSDNSRYVFEYVLQNEPKIEAIWLTRSKKVLFYLKNKGLPAFHCFSLRGLYYLLTAKAMVLSTGVEDVMGFVTHSTLAFQLWHGIPLKKIKFDDEKEWRREGRIKGFFYRYIFPLKYRRYDYGFATSPEVAQKFSNALNIPLKKIFITGFPRNDALFEHSDHLAQIIEKRKISRVLLYMPTHRSEGKKEIPILSEQNLRKIEETLNSLDALLLVKLHHFYDTQINRAAGELKNILFLQDTFNSLDIYPILSQTDVLITDYSSVFFDFLLTRKPIIFFPYDFHEYITVERSLYYDYESVTPGPKAYTLSELIALIKTVDKWFPDYKEKYEQLLQKFHTFTDGNYTKRVVNHIKRTLKIS